MQRFDVLSNSTNFSKIKTFCRFYNVNVKDHALINTPLKSVSEKMAEVESGRCVKDLGETGSTLGI
jgi:hypothetical protein